MSCSKVNKFIYPNWADGLHLGHDEARVHKVQLIGKIATSADLNKFVLKLRSTNDTVDYTESFKITILDGDLVQIESTFESTHKAKMYVDIPTPNIFASITSGFIEYTLTAKQ